MGEARLPKVLVCHNHYQQAGGEDRVCEQEIALLEQRGHEVVLYRAHNDHVAAMGRLTLAATTVWSQPTYVRLRELVRRERPAVVHVHNTLPLLSPAVYYAARAEGAAVVQTLHNYRFACANALLFREGRVCEDCVGRAIPWPAVVHQCYRDSRAASAAVTAMLAVHRCAGTWRRQVDAYIAPSAAVRAKMIEAGLPGERIFVKPHFVAPDGGAGDGGGGNAVFVGRLAAEKGVHTLLEAWRGLGAEVPLTILGDGPLAGTVAACGIPGVTWMGRRSPAEVSDLIGRAACLVFPSECHETFGLVIAEAFARGTPVIASNIAAANELIEDGVTGAIFAPGDALGLASAVRRFLADAHRRESMRAAARAAFEHRLTADANYRLLLEIYAAARSRAAAPALQSAATG